MNLFIYIKRRKLAVLCSGICLVLAAVIAMQEIAAVTAANTNHLVPICRVQTEEKKIAISFDTDSGDSETKKLADILRAYHVKASFFVVGAWAEKHPDSVQMLVQDGHEICNHSNTHPHMPKLSVGEMRAQIFGCNKIIEKITGSVPVLFRAPYDDYSSQLIETAQSVPMYCIKWNIDSYDWKNASPKEIVKSVTSQAAPGSILLFHNGSLNTATALPEILSILQTRGYSIVPVSQLILTENYTVDETGTQRKS